MFNKIYVLLPAFLADLNGAIAAQSNDTDGYYISYNAAAEKYGNINFVTCNCDGAGTHGTAAYAENTKEEVGEDLCCKEVTVTHGETEVQTTFTDVCTSCEGNDIALNGELFDKIGGEEENDSPLEVTWSVQG
ncbi:hypothetical protein HDZ31DRAFT_60303 [Schizophyllum fasciatum]